MPKPQYVPESWRSRRQWFRRKYLFINVYGLHHPLWCDAVAVHRIVLWEKLNGMNAPCHWCHRLLIWNVDLFTDHLDHDKLNNDPSNLVPSCLSCNSRRRGERIRPSKPRDAVRLGASERLWITCGKRIYRNLVKPLDKVSHVGIMET